MAKDKVDSFGASAAAAAAGPGSYHKSSASSAEFCRHLLLHIVTRNNGAMYYHSIKCIEEAQIRYQSTFISLRFGDSSPSYEPMDNEPGEIFNFPSNTLHLNLAQVYNFVFIN